MLAVAASRRMSPPLPPTVIPMVYIVSSALGSLPAPGNRVGPGDATNMPTIQASTGNNALKTSSGAHHYRIIGVQFKAPTTLLQGAIVQIGGGETTLGAFPTDIVVDRCILRGDPTVGCRRGVAMEAIRGAVIDSYIYNIKEDGSDSQAAYADNTPGPLKIVNNYLEASGENVMFGGADPSYANSVPSDIEIRRNYFYKPLALIGSAWDVKNLLEFKNAQRVLCEGNVLENNWAANQSGVAFLITPRNQDNTAPWSVTKDITFRHNKVLNTESGTNVSGTDTGNSSQDTYRVTIFNNLICTANVNGGGNRRITQETNGTDDLQYINNTLIASDSTGSSAYLDSPSPKSQNNIYRNNVMYGDVIGDAVGYGTAGLNGHATNYTFTHNMMIAASGSYTSPVANCQLVANVTAAKFTNFAGGDYSLASDSPGHNAGSDGADIGANFTTLESYTQYTVNGQWGSEPATYSDRTYTNAELPREYVNTTYGAQSGNTWTATNTSASSVAGTGSGNRTDCSFSYALANLAIGDTIILSAGSTYTGSWTLRNI